MTNCNKKGDFSISSLLTMRAINLLETLSRLKSALKNTTKITARNLPCRSVVAPNLLSALAARTSNADDGGDKLLFTSAKIN